MSMRRRCLALDYPDAHIWDDLETFPATEWRGVELVTAGFPCQPWSVAGQGKGLSDDRWIWPRIADVICDIRPRIVFLENVVPLVGRGGLAPVLGSLASLGFDAAWGVFSCGSMGAPHQRRRLFILAHANHGQQRPGQRSSRRVADRSGSKLGYAHDESDQNQERPLPTERSQRVADPDGERRSAERTEGAQHPQPELSLVELDPNVDRGLSGLPNGYGGASALASMKFYLGS